VSAGVDVVEGCAGGVVWHRRVYKEEGVVPALATSVGGLGVVGLAAGWDFGVGGYVAMFAIAGVAWGIFTVASVVIRRRLVPLIDELGKRPRRAVSSGGAYRKQEEKEAAARGAISVTGRLYRLRPSKVRLYQRATLGQLKQGTPVVAGVVYQRKWICGGELDVWVGESVLVDDDGNAVVLASPSSRPEEDRLQSFVPVVGDSGRRFASCWVGDPATARSVRGIIARNTAQVVGEGDIVLLDAMSEPGCATTVTRAEVEARVGAIRSLAWVNLEDSKPLRLVPLA